MNKNDNSIRLKTLADLQGVTLLRKKELQKIDNSAAFRIV